MSSWKGLLCVLGAIALAYIGQRQAHGPIAAVIPAFFQTVLFAMGAAAAVTVGLWLFVWLGELEEDDVDRRFIGAATLGFVYGLLILALVSKLVYQEDRAKARDELLDRAADHLRSEGRPVAIPQLKQAMREVEGEERSDHDRE